MSRKTKIESIYQPISREEVLRQLNEMQAQYIEKYLSTIVNEAEEVRRLTRSFLDGALARAIEVRLKALGAMYWPAALCEYYLSAKRAENREKVLGWAIYDVRASPSLWQMAVRALRDRSRFVRFRAHKMLAYALDQSALPILRSQLQTEFDPELRRSLAAAVLAIEKQDHHLYIDDKETGRMGWTVDPWTARDPAMQHAELQFLIDEYRKAWETNI